MIDSGCYFPEPELLGVQIGAIMVFQVTTRSWGQDPMSGQLDSYDMALAHQIAEGYGFEWDSDFQDWILAASLWYKAEFQRRKLKKENDKNRHAKKGEEVIGRESPVNS